MYYQQTARVSDDERRLRTAIFMDEQGFKDEFDAIDDDPRTIHVVMYGDDGTPVACCRCYPSPAEGEWTLGRVAVRSAYRRSGLATALVKEAERRLKTLGATAINLGAQTYVTELYAKLGYIVSGPGYADETVPHTPMRKAL